MPIAAGLTYALSARGTVEQPSVVLVHGAGSSNLFWPPEIRRLPGWNVYAVDLPGHGRSGGQGLQTIERYAEVLSEFMDETQLYQVILAGHSMGGAIALLTALRQPGRVAGLGMIASGAHLDLPEVITSQLTTPLTFDQAVAAFQQLAFSPSTPKALVESCMQPLRETRYSLLAGDWQACAAFDQRGELEKIGCPVWIAAGTDDRLTPVSFARYMAACIPNSRLDIFKDCGHMLVQEKPAELAARLREFLISVLNYRFAM